jgi:hypothetical protein
MESGSTSLPIVKLADFGLSTECKVLGYARRDGLVGTPTYFAPEMLAGVAWQMQYDAKVRRALCRHISAWAWRRERAWASSALPLVGPERSCDRHTATKHCGGQRDWLSMLPHSALAEDGCVGLRGPALHPAHGVLPLPAGQGLPAQAQGQDEGAAQGGRDISVVLAILDSWGREPSPVRCTGHLAGCCYICNWEGRWAAG